MNIFVREAISYFIFSIPDSFDVEKNVKGLLYINIFLMVECTYKNNQLA